MVSRSSELIMQGENFKQVFILALSIALLIAIFVPLLWGVFKPSVFHGERLAGLQTIFFGIVISLSLAVAGYLLIFFETSNAV
jgi:hypothetical protein